MLLRAAARRVPLETVFTLYERLGELPHFTPDLDGEGAIPPPSVAEFRRVLADAEGVLISCPEYAHGVPGSFKNALDWIVSSGELTDKPVAVIAASASGAARALAGLTPTLRVMGATLVFEAAMSLSKRSFDPAGELADRRAAEVVEQALAALTRRRPA